MMMMMMMMMTTTARPVKWLNVARLSVAVQLPRD